MSRIGRLRINLTKAGRGFVQVFSNPKYAILAIIVAFLVSILIYLSINFNFYGSMLMSGMSLVDKIRVVGLMVGSMSMSYFQDLNGILLLVLSSLQGVAVSLLVYNFRHNQQVDKKIVAGSGIVAVASVIGLGCVPCGTSLLVPLMALLFSSSSYILLNTANLLALLLASVLSMYSIYKMGLIVHVNSLMTEWKKETAHEKI